MEDEDAVATMRSAKIAAYVGVFACMSYSARALPVDDFVTVQLIDVCNGTGPADSTHCAPLPIVPSVDLYNFSLNQVAAVTETTWAQAGISFNFLPTINKYYNASFLATTVDDVPTDEAHQLFRQPGHGQNADANTLNVFFVDSTPTSKLDPVYGYGLRGSNGAVISGEKMTFDRVAHELGHNLGLVHVDDTPADSPNNLMRTGLRTFPSSLSDITSGRSDQLNADQIRTARQPLFTVNGATASVKLDLLEIGLDEMHLSFAQNGSSESLNGLKIRYSDANLLLNTDDFDSLGVDSPCISGASAALLNGSGNLDQTFSSAFHTFSVTAHNQPVTGGLEVTLTLDASCVRQNPVSGLTLFASDLFPFSFEFDFTDGRTSTGLYDQTAGFASSDDPITVGFVGQPTTGLGQSPPPEVPHPPGSDLDLDIAPANVPAPKFPWFVVGAALVASRMGGRRSSRSGGSKANAPQPS